MKIPLENGFHTYGRVLEVEMDFYDIYTENDLPIEEITEAPVLFITTVYDSVITKVFWTKVSKAIPPEEYLIETPPKYTQDRLNLSRYRIHYNARSVLATKEECQGLEVWAVWHEIVME